MAGHRRHNGHHRHGIDPDAGDLRVVLAIAANMALTLAQVIGGLLSGSLALLADALHNLSDAFSLIIALVARKIARRPKNDDMTFGYSRIEIVAALVNYTTLFVIALYLMVEAVDRFLNPQDVNGWIIVVIATVALALDAVTALLTFRMSKDSVNIRAAYLHNLADALGSAGVIVVGTGVLLFGWVILDPIITMMISVYVLWQVSKELPATVRILMLASPKGQETADVLATLSQVDGVAGAHEVSFWQVDERESALGAHVVIDAGRWSEADAIKRQIKQALRARHGISRILIEMECSRHACAGQNGHGEVTGTGGPEGRRDDGRSGPQAR